MTTVRRWITHPALALGSTLLAGLAELVALTLSRLRGTLRRRVLTIQPKP